MFVTIQTVRQGDTIRETYLDGKGILQVEKGPGTKVNKIEHNVCSKPCAHVNSRECFDSSAVVWRERGQLPVKEDEVDSYAGLSKEDAEFDTRIERGELFDEMSFDAVADVFQTQTAPVLVKEILEDRERSDAAFAQIRKNLLNSAIMSPNEVQGVLGY